MSFQDFRLKIQFSGFSQAHEVLILRAIQIAYEQSPAFEAMIDRYLSQSYVSTVRISFAPGAPGAHAGTIDNGEVTAGPVHIDLGYLSNMTYLTDAGKAEPVTLAAAIVHELVHSLTGKEDDLTDEDYQGDTVRESNLIYAQLGIPLVNSYRGQDERGVLTDKRGQLRFF